MADEPRWSLEFERRAERDLERLDPQIARRIVAALDRLLDRDPSLDLRLLQGGDEWRLRVGDWRVRLRLDFETQTVVVVRVHAAVLAIAEVPLIEAAELAGAAAARPARDAGDECLYARARLETVTASRVRRRCWSPATSAPHPAALALPDLPGHEA